MNVFLSSAFNSDMYQNSKSCFSNELPLLYMDKPSIQIRSALLDNRLSLLHDTNKPFCIIRSKRPAQGEKHNSFFQNDTKTMLSFRTKVINISISISSKETGKLLYKKDIKIRVDRFGTVSEAILVLNSKLHEQKSDITLGISKKTSKFYCKWTHPRKGFICIVSVDPFLSYAGGFSSTIDYTKLKLTQKHSIYKARFRHFFKKKFYHVLTLRNAEAESSTELCQLVNKALNITAESEDKFMYVEKDTRMILAKVKSPHFTVYFSSYFLSSLLHKPNDDWKPQDLSFLKLSFSFFELKTDLIVDTIKLPTPKLYKIFCSQVHHSGALTSSSLNLLALLPHSYKEFYKHCTECSTPLTLNTSHVERLEFKLTDEKNRQLNLTTGAPTLIHCKLSGAQTKMYKLCHFNSGDLESFKYYPYNTSSHFTQKFSTNLDTRVISHFASLQSIYIPNGVHNISSAYTRFTVSTLDGGDVKEKSCFIPDGYYTEESFIEEFNRSIAYTQIVMILVEKKLQVISKNTYTVQIKLNPQLSYLLGYTNNVEEDVVTLEIKPEIYFFSMMYTYKFSSLTMRYIKVIANILAPSLMGQSYEKIMRVINLSDRNDRQDLRAEPGYFVSFPSNHWVKLEANIYSSVTITLTDENNIPLVFTNSSESVEGVFVVESDSIQIKQNHIDVY